MTKLGACLGFLVLFADSAPQAVAADPSGNGPRGAPGSSPENTLFGKLFGKKEPPPPPPATGPRLNPREQASKTIMEEQQAHLQRLAICTRLRELADETGNEELNQKAEELEKQAYEVYTKRISHLPGTRGLDKSADSLDRQLGRGVATDPIESDAKKPVSKEAKASAKREESK
jgi:hypothetical protein